MHEHAGSPRERTAEAPHLGPRPDALRSSLSRPPLGVLTRSLALLADAAHMLDDVAALTLALVAMRFAERPATPQQTFGFYRVEILATLA